jgi:hypothetical protein
MVLIGSNMSTYGREAETIGLSNSERKEIFNAFRDLNYSLKNLSGYKYRIMSLANSNNQVDMNDAIWYYFSFLSNNNDSPHDKYNYYNYNSLLELYNYIKKKADAFIAKNIQLQNCNILVHPDSYFNQLYYFYKPVPQTSVSQEQRYIPQKTEIKEKEAPYNNPSMHSASKQNTAPVSPSSPLRGSSASPPSLSPPSTNEWSNIVTQYNGAVSNLQLADRFIQEFKPEFFGVFNEHSDGLSFWVNEDRNAREAFFWAIKSGDRKWRFVVPSLTQISNARQAARDFKDAQIDRLFKGTESVNDYSRLKLIKPATIPIKNRRTIIPEDYQGNMGILEQV